MKSMFLFLLFALSFTTANSQEVSVVKGRLEDLEFSKVSLQSNESPLTGARDEFEAILLDSGKFIIQAELYVPKTFKVLVDDAPIAQVFLCPGKDLTINYNLGGLKIEGPSGDFYEWNRVLMNDYLNKYSIAYAESQGIDIENAKSLTSYLFDLKREHVSRLNKTVARLSLDSCELTYFKDRIDYAIYTFLWSNLLQRGYSIESDAFQFMHELPLNDKEAAISSLDYNRAIGVYIYLKLRIENGWYESNSFDPSSDAFNNLYYDKILTEIQNEDVKNVTLTRKVVNLLSTGSTSGESLFKKYLDDCSNPFYKEVAFRYYNDYLEKRKNSNQDIKIEELQGLLFEELKQHKGKVLYIDFWASWCQPCIGSLPFTKKLQEKYQGQPLEVIYVSIDDNIGSSKAAAKKLGLKGRVIHLNKEQSTEIRKLLKIQGIPHYTLLDQEGTIVARDAPHPDSGAIHDKLNQLLRK